jgi:DNA-directed RNA polymerase subunit M/transcription elongation factor TFIIS
VESLDPALEYLRIADRYRQMSDEEVLIIASQRAEITDLAQQALAAEVQSRGLKIEEPKQEKSLFPITSPPAFSEHESPQLKDSTADGNGDSYDDDRKLVELCMVWSLRDALQVQYILDVAGIPFVMGPEKATGVEAVTSNFSNGVKVGIMQIGLPWAGLAMKRYEPADDPYAEHEKETQDVEQLVHCPRCHSTEVIFQDRVHSADVRADDSNDKFEWTCDSCGYKWVDDGIVAEG